jgi:hypothetical protein
MPLEEKVVETVERKVATFGKLPRPKRSAAIREFQERRLTHSSITFVISRGKVPVKVEAVTGTSRHRNMSPINGPTGERGHKQGAVMPLPNKEVHTSQLRGLPLPRRPQRAIGQAANIKEDCLLLLQWRVSKLRHRRCSGTCKIWPITGRARATGTGRRVAGFLRAKFHKLLDNNDRRVRRQRRDRHLPRCLPRKQNGGC